MSRINTGPRGKAVLIIGYGDAKGRGQSLFLLGQGLPPSRLDVGRGRRPGLIGIIRYLNFGFLLSGKYDSLKVPGKNCGFTLFPGILDRYRRSPVDG